MLGTLKFGALRKGGGWRSREEERSDFLGAGLAGSVASALGASTAGEWLDSAQRPLTCVIPALVTPSEEGDDLD